MFDALDSFGCCEIRIRAETLKGMIRIKTFGTERPELTGDWTETRPNSGLPTAHSDRVFKDGE